MSQRAEMPFFNSRFGTAVLKADAASGNLLRCGDDLSLRASVRVTALVLGRTKLLRSDGPEQFRQVAQCVMNRGKTTITSRLNIISIIFR